MTTKKIEQKKAKGAKKLPTLLNCPFCSEPADHFTTESKLFWVGCSKGCVVTSVEYSRRRAAETWNRRVPFLPSSPAIQTTLAARISDAEHAAAVVLATQGRSARKGGGK